MNIDYYKTGCFYYYLEQENKNIIYQGQTTISIQSRPEYTEQIVYKEPSGIKGSTKIIQSLEKEYETTKSLDHVKGVRKTAVL